MRLARADWPYLLARDSSLQGKTGLPWAWAAAGVVFIAAAMFGGRRVP